MDINSLIAPYRDIEKFKNELNEYRDIIVEAAHAYSKASVDTVNEAFEVAIEGGPVISVLNPMADHEINSEKAVRALKSIIRLDDILLELEETTNPIVNTANKKFRKDTAKLHYINVDLEGAQNRAYVVKQTIPNVDITINTMCDPKLLEQAPPDDREE